MKVTFVHKTGREQVMRKRDAEVLQRLGRGAYLTRDMCAAQQAVVTPAAPTSNEINEPADPVAEVRAEADVAAPAVDNLNDLDAAQLHALAKERGIKIHHKAGADKVRDALRGAAQ